MLTSQVPVSSGDAVTRSVPSSCSAASDVQLPLRVVVLQARPPRARHPWRARSTPAKPAFLQAQEIAGQHAVADSLHAGTLARPRSSAGVTGVPDGLYIVSRVVRRRIPTYLRVIPVSSDSNIAADAHAETSRCDMYGCAVGRAGHPLRAAIAHADASAM